MFTSDLVGVPVGYMIQHPPFTDVVCEEVNSCVQCSSGYMIQHPPFTDAACEEVNLHARVPFFRCRIIQLHMPLVIPHIMSIVCSSKHSRRPRRALRNDPPIKAACEPKPSQVSRSRVGSSHSSTVDRRRHSAAARSTSACSSAPFACQARFEATAPRSAASPLCNAAEGQPPLARGWALTPPTREIKLLSLA